MRQKRQVLFSVLLVVAALWLSGLIPKYIGKMYGIYYTKNNFPKMELRFLSIEWSSKHEEYIIFFDDPTGESYSFTLGPKLLPIVVGQGESVIREKYMEFFSE